MEASTPKRGNELICISAGDSYQAGLETRDHDTLKGKCHEGQHWNGRGETRGTQPGFLGLDWLLPFPSGRLTHPFPSHAISHMVIAPALNQNRTFENRNSFLRVTCTQCFQLPSFSLNPFQSDSHPCCFFRTTFVEATMTFRLPHPAVHSQSSCYLTGRSI